MLLLEPFKIQIWSYPVFAGYAEASERRSCRVHPAATQEDTMTHSSLSLCAMNFKFSITHDKNAEAKVHLIISEHYNKNKELCFTASQPLNLLDVKRGKRTHREAYISDG